MRPQKLYMGCSWVWVPAQLIFAAFLFCLVLVFERESVLVVLSDLQRVL